ncbi:hypothetical protein M409DRAFT_48688 [Zasmidium cellare ATCC 36951]|uniref:AAA+ ATPase domain-containing protein n=1 Tax=Zasmidium cellare ATCC 36951 TaxID=1080233 RepID=A0A6A6D801_ZASCE|nr:uncharacterized protein M409DRAFT_48688 [Zasmidium cellare ATCC 36951]KAF2173756.1 hypothetical protein M409DRAFT_48688 [Zasmidium cellare ATCC 36951]
MDRRTGSKCELKIWQERSGKHGKREIVPVTELGGLYKSDEQYAVVVRQVFDKDNVLEKTTLTINSAHLLTVFREVVGYHPNVPADFSEPFEMESPFQMLFHFWHDLDQFKESTHDDDCRMHLNLLFEFMEADMGDSRRLLVKSAAQGQVQYDTLWTIYRPGDLVLTRKHGHPWLLRVEKTAYEESTKVGPYFEVHCTGTGYDGHQFGNVRHIFNIMQKRCFAQRNPSKIVELPIFPRRYWYGGGDLETQLMERGRHFLSISGTCTRSESQNISYEPVTKKDHVTDSDCILCPPFVHGFSAARREWCRFYLSSLHTIDWKRNPYDALILPDQQLRLVRSLVSAHEYPARDGDEAAQKGKGLVVLLYGPPGSGKTLTAECAAEATHRILFSVSMHSLNKYDSPTYFERNLSKLLRLATLWRAVVLFDEADVFLEARVQNAADSGNTTRNALVAIFLRHLEYFSGVVFLTTNRIKVFDEAMKSRVHLALGYPAPDLGSRRRIWSQCLELIPPEQMDLEVADVLHWLSKEPLNGREISNIVNTACTLARDDGVSLNKTHLESLIEVRHDFEVSFETMRASLPSPDPLNRT